jgi:hypothetical protein
MSTTGLWRYENRLIAVLSLMFGFVFFDRNAMSYLATFAQEDLQLNNTEIGMLASALSFTWAISGLLVGLGPGRLIRAVARGTHADGLCRRRHRADLAVAGGAGIG